MHSGTVGQWGVLGFSGGAESGLWAPGGHREKGKSHPTPALSFTRELTHAWSNLPLKLSSPPQHLLLLSTAFIIFQDLL